MCGVTIRQNSFSSILAPTEAVTAHEVLTTLIQSFVYSIKISISQHRTPQLALEPGRQNKKVRNIQKFKIESLRYRKVGPVVMGPGTPNQKHLFRGIPHGGLFRWERPASLIFAPCSPHTDSYLQSGLVNENVSSMVVSVSEPSFGSSGTTVCMCNAD